MHTTASCYYLQAEQVRTRHLWTGLRSVAATMERRCRRAKSRPRHAPMAQFKWKLDELLGSDPAIASN